MTYWWIPALSGEFLMNIHRRNDNLFHLAVLNNYYCKGFEMSFRYIWYFTVKREMSSEWLTTLLSLMVTLHTGFFGHGLELMDPSRSLNITEFNCLIHILQISTRMLIPVSQMTCFHILISVSKLPQPYCNYGFLSLLDSWTVGHFCSLLRWGDPRVNLMQSSCCRL